MRVSSGVVAVITGQPGEVPHRGPGIWPQQATGQRHPLACAEKTPANIPFDRKNKSTEEIAAHEHTESGAPEPDKHDEHDDDGHGHSHGGPVTPEKVSKLDRIALKAEVGQRSPQRAHRPVPESAQPVVVSSSASQEGDSSGKDSENLCYVINYAQPESFYREQQQRRAEATKDAFWFKYSI